jgi:hypothetical protein
MYRDYKNNDRKLEIFSAAGLIGKFNKGTSLEEIYKRGIRCYGVLLDLLENPEIEKEISKFTKLPLGRIKITAFKIVNLFLLNKENNPFLSLGLSNDALDSEIKKRWKRLLVIYHPDRSFNQKGYEEMAKKINQAYREISELQGENARRGKDIREQWDYIPIKTNLRGTSSQIFHNKYVKHLPTFILVTVIFIAIFTIAVFIIHRI